MSSTVNEVNGENLQDPPIKNPGYANAHNETARERANHPSLTFGRRSRVQVMCCADVMRRRLRDVTLVSRD